VRLEPVTLEGTHVRLEPVTRGHVDGLWHAGRDPQVWAMRPYPVYSRDDMETQVRAAIDDLVLAVRRTARLVSPRPAVGVRAG
jgi:hypothetical protein